MKYNKKVIGFLMMGFLWFVPHVIFASELGIAVDQTAIVFDADSGESQKFVVEIKNISTEEQEVNVGALDYILGDNNELILNAESDEMNGVKDWISTQDNNVVIAPGKVENIVFNVEVPENAIIGSHRGAVIFSVTPESDDTVKVHGQIGVHVLVNVKGDTNASGQVNYFDIPFLTLEVVDYESEFENTGNIHYVPYGDIVVTNIFTKTEEVYKYEKHFVFPGKKVIFSTKQEIPSLFGLYKAKVTFVDGEGVTRTKIDYTMGYFFPIVFIVVMVIIFGFLWKIYKKGKLNQADTTIKSKQEKIVKNNTKKKESKVDNEVYIEMKKEKQVSEEEKKMESLMEGNNVEENNVENEKEIQDNVVQNVDSKDDLMKKQVGTDDNEDKEEKSQHKININIK
jgi:uncharacterized membrane protein